MRCTRSRRPVRPVPGAPRPDRPARRRPAARTLPALVLVTMVVGLGAACSSNDAPPGAAATVPAAGAAGAETVSGATLVPLGGGAPTTLHAYRGTPMVVNLWASWCAPCRTEMPELEAAHRRYGEQVAFVGVTDDPNLEAARQVATDTGVTYPLLVDEAGDVQVDLGVSNLPATVFVDAEGRIVSRKLGKVTAGDIDAGVAGLLGGGS